MAKLDKAIDSEMEEVSETKVELQAPDGVTSTVIEGVTYKVNHGVVIVPAQHKAMLLESFGYTLPKKSK